jgi:hypothetical protein
MHVKATDELNIMWRVTPCRNRVSTVPCRREPTKAEESRSEPSQQKGGMFILRCSATVGYTRHAISTTIEKTFSGRCTIEGYIRGTGMSTSQSGLKTRVEAGSNTSTVTLRDVGGDKKGSPRTETVKYGRKSQGTRTRERLRWQGPVAHTKDRPVLSSERATHGIKNVTVRRIPYSERKKNLVVSPGWVLYTKTDWPTDRRSNIRLRVSLKKWIRGVRSRREFRSVRCRVCDNLRQ